MGLSTLTVLVDSRIWLPPKLPKDFAQNLRAEFTHSNPDYYKRKATGYSTWGIGRSIKTFDKRVDHPRLGERLTLPRGGLRALKRIAADNGIRLRFVDRRISCPVEYPRFCVDPEDPGKVLYPHQLEAVRVALKNHQGVIRAATGGGKTIAALAFLHEVGERAIVILRSTALLKQWLTVAEKCLGIPRKEIGIVMGGRKYRPGKLLTLALQQSLNAKGNRLDELLEEEPFGAVIVDEVQELASKTFQVVIDRFPSKYRIGFSADETRKDKKEFLIYDEVGPMLMEISRQDLEKARVIHPVTVRVIRTEFRADWYRDAEPADRDFNRLLDEMTTDVDRNELLVDLIRDIVQDDETPSLVFTHRRDHADELADKILPLFRIKCGLLLGGPSSSRRFDEDMERLYKGQLELAVGTYKSIGIGIDLPLVRSGVCTTPISKSNRQFFGQVRGRLCRTATGKDSATMYYLADLNVFPGQLKALQAWNDGNVEIFSDGSWKPV